MDSHIDERDRIIRGICPHPPAGEQQAAAQRFDRYIDLLCRIATRIAADRAGRDEGGPLTGSGDAPTMNLDPSGSFQPPPQNTTP